jgi:hypothetical protein
MSAIPEYRSLSPDALDALERAVREGRRVALSRRGTEYVVVAEQLHIDRRSAALPAARARSLLRPAVSPH